MKKAGIILIMCILMSASAQARVYVDGAGTFVMTGDAKNEFGGCLGVFAGLTRDVNVFVRTSYSSAISDADTYKETTYGYLLNLAGAQYQLKITGMPLYWITSLGLGMSYVYREQPRQAGPYINPSETEIVDDKGFAMAIYTGVLFELTQSLSIFAEAGYHKSFYSDKYIDNNIGGIQVLFGVRVTVWGSNNSIYDEY